MTLILPIPLPLELPSTTDLRVKKTHLLIRQAIIALLHDHEYKDITVQLILDTAMVNRATFYKYYSGKNDLVGQMIAEFKREYEQALKQRLKGDLADFFSKTVPVFFQKRQVLLALWKVQTRKHHLYQDMQAIIKQIYIEKASQSYPHREKGSWEFQSEIVANLALTSMHYHFSHDKLPTLALVNEFQQIRTILEI